MEIENKIEELLDTPPFSIEPNVKGIVLLELLKKQIALASEQSLMYGNYVRNWPVRLENAMKIEELPYLPVSVFKRKDLLRLVPDSKIHRIMLSSSTSGQEPSRIAIDLYTSRRMTKGIINILRDFIGPDRRPYLVVDELMSNSDGSSLGARGAAIRGIMPFATDTFFCITREGSNNIKLDIDGIKEFIQRHKEESLLVYGFTTVLWSQLLKPLRGRKIGLDVKDVHILHSGGWKKLQDEAVTKNEFNSMIASFFGCEENRVIDFYGMIENLGVIYPDCPEGNKHSPVFGEVIVRDPLTLSPVKEGNKGIVQVCSVLPSSFPGYLLLTEDMARVIDYDGCSCGRRGISFQFEKRVPMAELRGCGNIDKKLINCT